MALRIPDLAQHSNKRLQTGGKQLHLRRVLHRRTHRKISFAPQAPISKRGKFQIKNKINASHLPHSLLSQLFCKLNLHISTIVTQMPSSYSKPQFALHNLPLNKLNSINKFAASSLQNSDSPECEQSEH